MTPTDQYFDDMHLALGRPADPHGKTFRNRYHCAADSDTAKRFEALGWWDRSRLINSGRDALYTVNDAGKQALADWLAGKAAEQ